MMKDKYKTLIISCWVVLLVYFVIKLLGGNYFEAICYNPNIVSICEFVDNNYWVSYLFKAPAYAITSYLVYLTITKQKLKDDWWMIIILLVQPFCKRYILPLGLAIDAFTLIIYPTLKLIFVNKDKWWIVILRVLIGNVLLVAFQLLSTFTRNIGYYIPLDNTLVGIIMSIDYYLMTLLYYLHTRDYYYKKEVK